MSPAQVEGGTFLTNYLHAWAGVYYETEPVPAEFTHRSSCLGLIRWADQPSKRYIYLVRQLMIDEDGDPGELWHNRLKTLGATSGPSPSPPAPPPPDDDQPEDEQRKDKAKAKEAPGPSELFRARERQSTNLKGSIPQGSTTASISQPSSTLPQHHLGLDRDPFPTHDPHKKIQIPPGFIDPAAQVSS